jgi:hypothetical protein
VLTAWPKHGDFPASRRVDDTSNLSDAFGCFRYHVSEDGLGFDPAECFSVIGVASTGAFDAAEVFGHDPADPADVYDRRDIRLMVGREFDPAGFDTMIGVVSRCSRFSSDAVGAYTVHILEDSRPAVGPQSFRYSLATAISGDPADATRTEYFSYART